MVGIAVLALAGLSLFVGVSSVSPIDVWHDDGSARSVFLSSRIPRTMAVVLSGAAIAVAGLVMQTVTQNRFVSPSTAGTTEAAVLGVVVAAIVLPGAPVGAVMGVATVFALAGTLCFVALIQQVRRRDLVIVPLLGIMLGAVLSSVAVFLAFREGLLQSMYTWMIGDFSGTISGRYELLYLVGGVTLVAYFIADRLTLAGVGREFSVNVGLRYDRTVLAGMALVALSSGVVVVVVGAIPFFGLIVPNLVTAAFGDNVRRTLPMTAAVGAAGLLAADVAARTIRAPYEVPVGLIVGVAGGAAFLVLLLRSRL